MKYFYIFICILAVYFLVEIIIFYFRVQNAPKLSAPAQEKTVQGTGPFLRYVAMGDSTASGVGASDQDTSYAGRIAKLLSETYAVEYKNIGVIGAKTQDVLDHQLEEAIAFKPNIVTISIGANDATHLLSKKKILANEQQIIDRLLNETTAMIYLTDITNFGWADILPWFFKSIIEFRDRKINIEIKKFEGERVKIVNIHDFGWDTISDLKSTVAPDQFHPNDAGYINWFNAFKSRIE